MNCLRVFIADDHDVMRRGVRALVESHFGWQICGEARDGSEAVSRCQELTPDVVVLDFNMPVLNGLEAAKRILKTSPGTEVLILSIDHSNQLIRELLLAGVRGYVLKSDSDRDLVAAIEALANHKPFFANCAMDMMLNSKKIIGGLAAKEETWKEPITSREQELLRLIAEGMNSKEAASVLGISAKTADTHRANLMRKLQVHSVTELVRYAIRNRIVDL